MYRLIILLICVIIFPTMSHAAVWVEIPSTELQDVKYDWTPNSAALGGFSNIIDAWSGAALDTTRNRLLIWGGGHTDYGGQEIYAFDIDLLTWSRVSDPEAFTALDTDCSNDPAYKTDNGLPKAQHTYDRIFYLENIDSLCDTGGSNSYPTCGSIVDAVCYSFTNDEWSYSAISDTDVVGGSTSAGHLDSDTGYWWVSGGMAYGEGQGMAVYNPTTDSWTIGPSDNIMALQSNKIATIDTSRNLFVLAHGNVNYGIYALPQSEHSTSTLLKNYEVTTSGTAPNYAVMGFVYDPVAGDIVAWDGGTTIYHLNTSTWAWTSETATGDTPPSSTAASGTFGRFEYIESRDQFILVNGVDENVFFLDLREDAQITTVNLTSSETNTDTPFTFGIGFKKGDVPDAPTTDLSNYQVEVKKRWNDNSVKHAIISGRYNSTADTAKTINILSGGTQPSGTDLVESDIVSYNTSNDATFTATVAFSGQSWTTVDLDDLLGSPDRTFISGPEMVECHYHQDVSENSDVTVKFYVRYYSNDDIWVRVAIESGILDGTDGDDYTYTPTVTIGGSTVYNTEVVHYGNTRWCADGWINVTEPDIIIAHDVDYMKESRLVPNYWKDGPSETRLNSLTTTYTPMDQGDFSTSMGTAGYQDQIGLLPTHDAFYINSNCDERAFRAVVVNGKTINSYPIVWRDSSTDMPIILDSWGTWTKKGANGLGDGDESTGTIIWEYAHHPSAGYLAYLITGDYYYLETMQYQTTMVYLSTHYDRGSGTERTGPMGQVRGVAWQIRTMGQLGTLAPADSGPSDDLVEWLLNVIDYWYGVSQTTGINELGFLYEYNAGGAGFGYECQDGSGIACMGPWMHDFWVQALGFLSDTEPLSDMTNLNLLLDHMYEIPVGRLGPNGTDNFCFTAAGASRIKISAINDKLDPTVWYDSWGDVHNDTWDSPNTDCGNTLTEQYIDSPPGNVKGIWGNLLPAIAYAVDDGHPGAAAAWARFQGATNFSTFEEGGFDDYPVWGIVPRSYTSNGSASFGGTGGASCGGTGGMTVGP